MRRERAGGVRADLLMLAGFAALLFLVGLGQRDLWNPNEPTYGQAVAEMAERGDWLIPTVGGRAFGEKPILYYWAALACARLSGGVTELTLRLPNALAGIAAVLLAYVLVLPYAGRTRARLAALLLATTFMVWWGARSVQMDLPVALSTLAAVLAVVRVVDHGAPEVRGLTLAGAACGLGLLAKGPVAVVLPAAILAAYLVLSGRPRALRPRALLSGAAACALVGSPWYVALWARGETGLLAEVLYRQNVTRFIDAWDHAAPWWYYLEYFWIDMAPWAWFVPLAAALPGRSEAGRRLDRLAWVWIAAVLVFFSLSESKRSAYILPLAPAVAVLTSGLAERFVGDRPVPWRERAALGGMVAAALLLAGAGWRFQGELIARYPEGATPVRGLVLLLTAGALACLVGLLRPFRARAAVPAAFFSLVLCLYLFASAAVLPAANRYKSARGFGRQVLSQVASGERLASFGMWEWRAEHLFYTGRPIPALDSLEELRRYWETSERVFLIVEKRRLPQAREVIGELPPLIAAPIGSRTLYLFASPGPGAQPT